MTADKDKPELTEEELNARHAEKMRKLAALRRGANPPGPQRAGSGQTAGARSQKADASWLCQRRRGNCPARPPSVASAMHAAAIL